MSTKGMAEHSKNILLKVECPFPNNSSKSGYIVYSFPCGLETTDFKWPWGPTGGRLTTTEETADGKGQLQGTSRRLILAKKPGKSFLKLSQEHSG